MRKLQALTVLLSVTTIEVFSQKTVLIEDQTYHCFTQPQTELWVSNYEENQERKQIIFDFKKTVQEQEVKIARQSTIIDVQGEVIEEYRLQVAYHDSINNINEEIISISDEDMRKKLRNEKWSKAWNNWLKPVLIGVSAGAAGFGIGQAVR